MAGEDRPVADHTRPVRLTALAITAAYIAGVVLAAVPSAGSIAAAVAVATAAWLTNRRRPGLVPAAAVLLGWVGIGAVRLLLAAEPEPSGDGPVLMQLDGRVVGTVATIRVPPSKTLYGVSADRTEFDLLTPAGRVAVAVSGHCPDVVVGTRVRVTGRLVPQKPAGNPGERLRRPRLAEPTARLYASHPKTVVPLASSSGALSRLRQRLQTGIRSQLQSHLPLPAASLGRAVLLGDRHALPDEMTQRFRQTGLAHLLAISGLHVGLIAAVLIGPLRRLPVSSRTRFGLFAIALVGFAVLIQPAISAYRAVACAILLAGGRHSRRSRSHRGAPPFNALAASATAQKAIDSLGSDNPSQRRIAQLMLRFVVDLLREAMRAEIDPSGASQEAVRLLDSLPVDADRLELIGRMVDRVVTAEGSIAMMSPLWLVLDGLFDDLGAIRRGAERPMFELS